MKRKLLIAAYLLLAAFTVKAQPGFTLVGSAAGGPAIYNLTPMPGFWQAGAIWANGTNPTLPQFIDFNQCFTLRFFARETRQATGADGFCVVFGSNITLASVNNGNAYLGYYDDNVCPPPGSGIINPDFQQSLAVEFDIFDNSFFPCTFDPTTPYFDHTMIVRDAQFASIPTSVPVAPVPVLATGPTIKDGMWHRYEINWDCSGNWLSVTVDGNLRKRAHLIGAQSPAAIFGAGVGAVQWGFTGGTGAVNSDQEITQVWLQTTPPNVCVTSSCCTPDYQFNFTSTSPCPTTVWYAPVDFAGTWLCPPTSITFTGTGVLPWAALMAYCPSALGVCIVGYCDCNCCWGYTGGSINCTAVLPPAMACCAWVNPAHKTGTTSVGSTFTEDNQLAIVPNPSSGIFTVSGMYVSKHISTVQIDILDVTGKKVYSQKADVQNGRLKKNIELDASVPNGVYILKADAEGDRQQLQFTISR